MVIEYPSWYDKSLPYVNDRGSLMMPYTIINGLKIRVHELVRMLIEYHFPDSKSILDPTPGDKNYMMSPYLEQKGCEWYYAGRKYIAYSYKPTKYSIDCNGRHRRIDLLSNEITFNGTYDVALYDPPFKPEAIHDKRGSDYGIAETKPTEVIRSFYRREVFESLHQHVNMGVIVKGSDFSYPVNNERMNLFLWDVFRRESVEGLFIPVGLYVYRFTTAYLPLYRYRLAKRLRRTLTNHTYYIILYKLCDGELCYKNNMSYSDRVKHIENVIRDIIKRRNNK